MYLHFLFLAACCFLVLDDAFVTFGGGGGDFEDAPSFSVSDSSSPRSKTKKEVKKKLVHGEKTHTSRRIQRIIISSIRFALIRRFFR